MEIEIVELTPKLAKQYLSSNLDRQRTLRKRRVSDIARDITADRWRITGEAVKFDMAGRLVDGQHRCLAVIEADKSIHTLVVKGVQNDTFEVLDTGRSRSVADVLHIEGQPNTAWLAAVARCLFYYERFGTFRPAGAKETPTVSEILKIAREHSEEIQRLIKMFGSPLRGATQIVTATLSIAMFYTLVKNGVDEETVYQFFLELATGEGLRGDSPTFVLRKKLLDARLRPGHRLAPSLVEALLRVTWNKWLAGESVAVIKWHAKGPSADNYPQLMFD